MFNIFLLFVLCVSATQIYHANTTLPLSTVVNSISNKNTDVIIYIDDSITLLSTMYLVNNATH